MNSLRPICVESTTVSGLLGGGVSKPVVDALLSGGESFGISKELPAAVPVKLFSYSVLKPQVHNELVRVDKTTTLELLAWV